MEQHKDLLVAALENGSVIDHIPTDKVFTIAQLLKLDEYKEQVLIGNNLVSQKMGAKGVIKIANRFFSQEEINRLAVVCPNLRLTIIKDYRVVQKTEIELNDNLVGVVKCSNPVCITNNEPMKTIFNVTDKAGRIIKCRYCGKEKQI